MVRELINPNDSLEHQNKKLLKITATLIRRAQQGTEGSNAAYAQYQRAVMLEEEVSLRTKELERALDLLNDSNLRLARANAETEAARANLTNAIETLQEGFALFSPEEELVLCNRRFGKHTRDIYHKFQPGLKFQDYVRLVANSKFLALHKDETPTSWETARLARHKDDHAIFNTRMTGNRWLQVSEHRTPDGGTVVIQTDITDMMRIERQERERLLDDQSRLIRATLEHLSQGVFIFDDQTRLIGWNQRAGELLSIPAKRLQIGMYFGSIYDHIRDNLRFVGELANADVENWVSNHIKRVPLSFEIVIDKHRTLTVFAQEMPDQGFVMSFTDVTAERAAVRAISEVNETLEQRVAERTLELEDALSEASRANASKSRFVAAASHDLLQPLSAAKLFVSSLENDIDNADLKQRLAKADNALVSVEKILSALLDISKLDSGLAVVDMSVIDIAGMLDQLHEELEPLAAQKGLNFRVIGSHALVESDASYLRRILQNLVSNAIRYTESGGVLIGLRPRKTHVRVEIWDSGPGISEEDQQRVFDEFMRLDTKANPQDGMGLGLAIVDRACRLLGHPLHLQSTVGKGTCFAVEIQRSNALRPTSPQLQIAPPTDIAFTHLIAILIENDADLRAALTINLENWGLDVLPCATLEEAEALLAEIDIAPDVILADYQLDDGALGTDAILALRNQQGSIPACLITANRSPDISALCHKLNVSLIHKPVNTDALKHFLEQALL